MKRKRGNRRPPSFWRRRRTRIAFHAAVLVVFALNLVVLDSEDRIWMLCAIPVLGMSSLRLWHLRRRRKPSPAEILARLRESGSSQDGYSNPRHSSVTEAAGWDFP